MILDAASRMGSLVDDLLAFSRIGRAETQKTTINLEQLVKAMIGEIAPDTQGAENYLAGWGFADLLRRSFPAPAGVQ